MGSSWGQAEAGAPWQRGSSGRGWGQDSFQKGTSQGTARLPHPDRHKPCMQLPMGSENLRSPFGSGEGPSKNSRQAPSTQLAVPLLHHHAKGLSQLMPSSPSPAPGAVQGGGFGWSSRTPLVPTWRLLVRLPPHATRGRGRLGGLPLPLGMSEPHLAPSPVSSGSWASRSRRCDDPGDSGAQQRKGANRQGAGRKGQCLIMTPAMPAP